MGHRGFRENVSRRECKLSDLQLYVMGWFGIIKNFWPVLIFLIIKIPDLRRWEQNEEKKLEKAIKRDKLKREYHQEHTTGRY